MKRRIIAFALLAAVALVPLMGAKGCSSPAMRRVATPAQSVRGYPVRVGNELFWVGRVPPKVGLPGYVWKISGWTKRNHQPIWVRRYKG